MTWTAGPPAPRRSWLRPVAGIGAVTYLLATSVYLLLRGSWPTPDFLIPPLLLFTVIMGRGWAFLIDWAPFLLLLMVYQTFAGIADDLNSRVHFWELIEADQRLFGSEIVPPVLLQDRFFRDDRIAWYDWGAAFLHAAHFLAPAAFAFALWLSSRRTFWRYTLSFMTMFYAGFTTYYLYPAAPPWMAAEHGLIPPVTRVLIHTLSSLPASEPLALFYQHFSPNDVAAMPSMHAAQPALLALVALALWGWRALPAIAYPVVGGVAWVYLGEHYVIDILVGWLYALGAFLLVWLFLPWLLKKLQPARPEWGALLRRATPPTIPSWPLAALALALIVLVWIDPIFRVPLHPQQGPLIPALGVRAGVIEVTSLDDLDPRDCRLGSSSSLALDRELERLAEQYAGYLVGLDRPACFSITAMASIPTLTRQEIALIDQERASQAPQRLFLPDEPPGYLTIVQVGTLTAEVERRPRLVPGRRYAVVIRVDNTEHRAAVEDLTAQVARLAFGPSVPSP